VGTQVPQLPGASFVVAEQRSRGFGDHDLTAPAGGRDASRAIDLEAAVVDADAMSSSGVDPDAGPERMIGRPVVRSHAALDVDGGPGSPGRIIEDHEEGIPFGAHEVAVLGRDDLANQLLVLQVQLVIAGPQRPQERHRPLEVRAQERDRAFRQW
jgi:hypothetical protein